MKKLAEILEGYGLISPYTHYKDNVIVSCPFHSDSTPSCSIDLEKHLFYCFGCGTGGTALTLIMALERANNPDLSVIKATIKARKILKGVELPEEATYTDIEKIAKEPKLSYDEVMHVYAFYKSLEKVDWYQESSIYSEYFSKRGFSPHTLNYFSVRINHTSSNPLVIPLIEQGNFKGYVSRRIDSQKARKYKNNNGLDKVNSVFGNLQEESIVIVAEGMLDAMMCWQNSQTNVCSLLGNLPSIQQLAKIARYGEIIIWATDNDSAGSLGYKFAKDHYERNYPRHHIARFQFPEGVKDLGEITDYSLMQQCIERTIRICN